MRVAAVDLGTNTTRLLVAEVEDGRLDEIVRREAITRMGESVDRRRILLPTAIARVRNVLVDYRREAEGLGAERILAVGTSAVRDADNGEAFLGEVEWSYGFTTRLLDGGEEAELMLRGVASDQLLDDGTLVIDIGGGSTELAMAGAERIAWAVSTEAGSVRLTERHLPSDPPTEDEIDACAAHVRSLLPNIRVGRAIGVAGTVTTAASIDLGGTSRVHGHVLTFRSLVSILEGLASLPLETRRTVRGLAPARAPVIVGGLVVLREILERYRLHEVTVSERDLLHGTALEAAELPAHEEGAVPPMAFTCC
jgi:exopolyphosphatase / guanosine-5'-triphosphate,3'-diphosphate pyrophosphatase